MNRTEAAVLRQLKAMRVPLFDVAGCWPDGKIINRPGWDRETTLKAVGALRAWNTQGAAIYVRPSLPWGVVLLDDITSATVEAMKAAGLPPACVVETSPGNLQAWLKLNENEENKPLETRVVTRAVRNLVEQFGADPASADWRHFGRLGGFTNKKPAYEENGRFPFVLVHEASGVVAPAGRAQLIAALRELKKEDAAACSSTQIGAQALATGERITDNQVRGGLGTYAQWSAAIIARNQDKTWAHSPDKSRLDWMIVCGLLSAGWSKAACCEVLSQRLDVDVKHRAWDYVPRTVENAYKHLFPPVSSGDAEHE